MYLLDANVFIQANRAHYGLDFAPAFWDWLDQGNTAGLLCSIDTILTELNGGKNDLSKWASGHKPLFLAIDQATQASLTQLATWATAPGRPYSQAAVAEFLASADYRLVAYAHAHDHVVVTHEVPAPDAVKRVKIPDACRALGVKWVNPFTMLRTESVRFVLGSNV